jgi:hypothetical protein
VARARSRRPGCGWAARARPIVRVGSATPIFPREDQPTENPPMTSQHVPDYLRVKTPEQLQDILSELRQGLEALYEDRLEGLYLYGSYARGDAVSSCGPPTSGTRLSPRSSAASEARGWPRDRYRVETRGQSSARYRRGAARPRGRRAGVRSGTVGWSARTRDPPPAAVAARGGSRCCAQQRRRRDSNPHGLAPAAFRVRCLTS